VGLVVQHAFSANVINNSNGAHWIVDSGATCHVCNDRNLFIELNNLKSPLDIVLGDGRTLNANGCGTVTLILECGSMRKKCKFHDVLYVPELTYNLLSVSKAVEKGISFTFKRGECIIKDVNQRLITVAVKVGNLYQVTFAKLKDHVYALTEKQPEKDHFTKEDLWHR